MRTDLISSKQALIWKQPRFAARYYQLYADKELYAELYWTRWLSDSAQAVCGEQCWTFERIGFFRDRIQTTHQGTSADKGPELVATFQYNWLRNGDLQMFNGRSYRWERTRAFRNSWGLFDEFEQLVFELELYHNWFKQEASIMLPISQRHHPELTLLLCLCMYIAVCTLNDSAAAVAASSSAATT